MIFSATITNGSINLSIDRIMSLRTGNERAADISKPQRSCVFADSETHNVLCSKQVRCVRPREATFFRRQVESKHHLPKNVSN